MLQFFFSEQPSVMSQRPNIIFLSIYVIYVIYHIIMFLFYRVNWKQMEAQRWHSDSWSTQKWYSKIVSFCSDRARHEVLVLWQVWHHMWQMKAPVTMSQLSIVKVPVVMSLLSPMKAPVTMEFWQESNLMMGRRVGAWSTLIRGISLNSNQWGHDHCVTMDLAWYSDNFSITKQGQNSLSKYT